MLKEKSWKIKEFCKETKINSFFAGSPNVRKLTFTSLEVTKGI